MTDKKVIKIDDVPFTPVAWGRSKILVSARATGPANGHIRAEHIRVGITEYDPDTPHEPHSHPGQEEVIWVLSGRGYTETHGERQELFPGAMAFIPSGLEHKTAAVDAPMTAIIMKSPAADATGKVS